MKCETGEIETLRFYGNLVATVKKIEELLLGYALPAGGTIVIQLRKEDGTAQTIRTLSGSEYETVG